jgi:hypothetical protein
MTAPVTRRPRRPLIRSAMTVPGRVLGILRYLNDELLAAGEAMARSARAPQPRPQAQAAQATPAQPAPGRSEVLTRV